MARDITHTSTANPQPTKENVKKDNNFSWYGQVKYPSMSWINWEAIVGAIKFKTFFALNSNVFIFIEKDFNSCNFSWAIKFNKEGGEKRSTHYFPQRHNTNEK